MKKALRWILLIALLVAAGVGGTAWFNSRDGAKPVSYRFAKVERGPIAATVAASGTLAAVTTVQVGSQVSGQIKEINADFNTLVKQDQVIARIDPSTFELRVAQARADLDAARSAVAVQRSGVIAQEAERARVRINLAEAARDFERKKSLVEKGFLSPSERDKAQTLFEATREQVRAVEAQIAVNGAQVVSAEAAVKQREALHKQAQVDLDRTIIRAPVDGTVILRNVDAGQTVAASLQAPVLFTIARDLHDMQVETAIDEADVGRLKVGQRATFTVDAFPRRGFEGEIRQIRKSPQNVQNVISYTVVISAANPDLALLPGMTANVRIVVDQRESALKVPNATLRFRPADAGEQKPAASEAGAGATGGSQAGQAMQNFRRRIVEDVKPDAGQTTQLDTIFAESRNRFIALREVADAAERRRKFDRARVEMRDRIASILRPDQKPAYDRLIAETGARGRAATGRLWVLQGQKPVPVEVRIGLSDGTSTELVGDALKEGAEVILGLAQPEKREGPGLRGRFF